jgi:hypothetical protein
LKNAPLGESERSWISLYHGWGMLNKGMKTCVEEERREGIVIKRDKLKRGK